MLTATTLLYVFVGVLLSYNFGVECQANIEDLVAQVSSQAENAVNQGLSLGDKIRSQVQDSLRGLDNLGPSIQQSVLNGLKPVFDLQNEMNVKNGAQGVTIATYSPGGRQFIVQNYVKYDCDGTIDEETGTCSGNLRQFTPAKDEDFCYATSKAIVNNNICFSYGNAGMSVTAIMNNVQCKSSDGSPVFMTTIPEFRELCKNIATRAEYKYITELNPNYSGNIQCSGQNPTVCLLSEDLAYNFGHSNFISINTK